MPEIPTTSNMVALLREKATNLRTAEQAIQVAIKTLLTLDDETGVPRTLPVAGMPSGLPQGVTQPETVHGDEAEEPDEEQALNGLERHRGRPKRKKRHYSAAARKRMAEASRQRWARQRGESVEAAGQPVKRGRGRPRKNA